MDKTSHFDDYQTRTGQKPIFAYMTRDPWLLMHWYQWIVLCPAHGFGYYITVGLVRVRMAQMTEEDIELIKAHIRTYLPPPLSDEGSPWLWHAINQNRELYERAKAEEPSLTIAKYLKICREPIPLKKRKRR